MLWETLSMWALQLLQSLVFPVNQNKYDPLSYEEASTYKVCRWLFKSADKHTWAWPVCLKEALSLKLLNIEMLMLLTISLLTTFSNILFQWGRLFQSKWALCRFSDIFIRQSLKYSNILDLAVILGVVLTMLSTGQMPRNKLYCTDLWGKSSYLLSGSLWPHQHFLLHFPFAKSHIHARHY